MSQVVSPGSLATLASPDMEAAQVTGATRGTQNQSPFNLISKASTELKV